MASDMGDVISLPSARNCAHCGCAWPASATLSFDYDSRRSWLEDLRITGDPATYDLCSVHAGRFRPPRGWRHDDLRRMPEPVIDQPAERESVIAEPQFENAEIVLPEI